MVLITVQCTVIMGLITVQYTVIMSYNATVLRVTLVYNHPAARGIMGLMYGRVPPKLSKDRRLRSSQGPRTVLVARGRTFNP